MVSSQYEISEEKIKSIRIQKGMTMEKFGSLLEPIADKSLISKWERGFCKPNPKRIKQIAEIGNMPIEELIRSKSINCPNCNYNLIKEEFKYCPICKTKINHSTKGKILAW